MLPDCECKGRAFLLSLQEITEKKCEKISFAPILPLHSIAKSAVKPIFSPPPHPSFFAPKSPFFPLFPISNPIPGDFSRDRARFLPCEVHFFLVFPRFKSDFERFFEGSLLPFSFALPFLHSETTFPIQAPPSSLPYSTFISGSTPFPPLIHPTLHLLPPLSFSFLPTFPSSSPINARSCAPSRTTRVRVRLHLPTRQEVFVYCLHLFTHLPQSTVHQHIRCEEKQERAFTKYTTISKSTS